ncbi:MAG: alpha/beta hydrolase [Clostridiales bacterium]|nr:alpha/beta hydrolase [Clostridiales bacterium]
MKLFTVDLHKEYPFLQGGTLECLVSENPFDVGAENWKRPALIVIPGGGYAMVSRREGVPVASAFFAKGFQVFILKYLTAEDDVRYPEQLLEAASAVDYIKKNADSLNVNKDEVFVVGFSAGGHLTANLAVEHQCVASKIGVELDCKPTAVGLGYPVISKKHGHFGSYDNLLQGYTDEAKEELLKTLNLNESVSEHTPPAFIWATATDNVVPADNALRYALALANQNIPYELHIYPEGVHGLSVGHYEVNPITDSAKRVSDWVDACSTFFRMYTVEKF